MDYRREIDGLRAIAVIPVILFHAGFEIFSGGYVGVDVFFVISGYLITTIILSEKEKGTFSLVTFYERRARRIIPALFFVMLLSCLGSWLWLSPSHMEDFSQSLIAVSLFSSNFLFWKESGYWGVENELKPLLHTWSLAVEEQYYLLFPLFLMFMWRYGKRWILGSFFFTALASLLLSHWAAFNKPVQNFLLLPTRAWELAIGAGIAFYFLYRKCEMRSLLSHKSVDEVLGFAGLLLIAYSIFLFDETTPFPSFYALVPTVGTALIIIFSSKQTLVGKLLGTRALVGVGLISYSAYLWHQPIFVFARHRELQAPEPMLLLGLSVLSLVLAFFSWKYVESPFRKKGRFNRSQVFALTAFGSVLFIILGLIGSYTNGYQWRLENRVNEMVDIAKTKHSSKDLCEANDGKLGLKGDACWLVESTEQLTLLFGDSHAKSMRYAAKNLFKKAGLGLVSKTQNGCPPVLGVYRADDSDRAECVDNNIQAVELLKNNAQIKNVILTARWTLGIEGERFDNREGGIEYGEKPHLDILDNGQYLLHADYSHRSEIARAYQKTIEKLLALGKKVFLIYPVPEAGWDVPDYFSRYHLLNPEKDFDASVASTSQQVYKQRNKRAIEALDAVSSHSNLVRIYPHNMLCNRDLAGRCVTFKSDIILYSDDDHLSDAGAAMVLQSVVNDLKSR